MAVHFEDTPDPRPQRVHFTTATIAGQRVVAATTKYGTAAASSEGITVEVQWGSLIQGLASKIFVR